MRTLFIHTGEVAKIDSDNNYYTDGSYDQGVWNRYFVIAENLDVIFRVDKTKLHNRNSLENYNKLDKRIKVLEYTNITKNVYSFINLKKRIYNKQLFKDNIIKSNFVIIRGLSNYPVKLCKKHNVPFLIEVVGCPFDTLWNHSFKGKIMSIFNYFKLKKMVINAPYVSYVTSDFLQKRYPTKGKMISSSDVNIIPMEIDEYNTKKEKLINSKLNVINITTIGAVNVKYKNHKVVLKALKKLNTNEKKYIYHIVGGGDQSKLKRIVEKLNIEENVIFHGVLEKNKVYDLLLETEIYIQPSLSEGLPRSVIEAMSRGCLLLGSNVGGIPELINDKYIFDPRNDNEIVNIIENLSKDDFIYNFKENTNKSNEFNNKIINEKLVNFYEKIKRDIKHKKEEIS